MGRAARAKRERRETGVDPRRERDPLLVKGLAAPGKSARGSATTVSPTGKIRHGKSVIVAAPPPRWKGEPCAARLVLVQVAENDGPCRKLGGRERRAVEVRVRLGSAAIPDHRAAPPTAIEGADRSEVVFYLDDEEMAVDDRVDEDELVAAIKAAGVSDVANELTRQWGYPGWAWDKVTKGRGSARYAHLELPVARVLGVIGDDGKTPTAIVLPETTSPSGATWTAEA